VAEINTYPITQHTFSATYLPLHNHEVDCALTHKTKSPILLPAKMEFLSTQLNDWDNADNNSPDFVPPPPCKKLAGLASTHGQPTKAIACAITKDTLNAMCERESGIRNSECCEMDKCAAIKRDGSWDVSNRRGYISGN
jgi:hypothetical protein